MDQERWDRLAQVPLLVASLVYLVAYSLQVLLAAPPLVGRLLGAVVWIVWAIFLVDYLVRFATAKHRTHWFLHHLFDLATVALPWLRPLRLLVLLRSVLQVSRSRAAGVIGTSTLGIALVAVAFVVWVGSLAVYSVERTAPGATITSFGDAVWWSVETVTTVGYGDYTPKTVTGRIIATGIMLVGIALIGAVTASLAAWVQQRATAAQQVAAKHAEAVSHHTHGSSSTSALHAEIASLHEQLAAITKAREHAGEAAPAPPSPSESAPAS